jgi:hypothetical protein
MNRNLPKTVFILLQVGAMLFTQWLFALSGLPLLTAAHNPLDDCAEHRCGCNPDVAKRKACCCHPEFAPADRAREETHSWHQLIREAQCEGTPSAQSVLLQFELPLPAAAESICDELPVSSFRTLNFFRPALSADPPEPPPKLSSLV